MTPKAKKHPTETPEYRESLARSERGFAEQDRRRRRATVESIYLHEQNAQEYDAYAATLRLKEPDR